MSAGPSDRYPWQNFVQFVAPRDMYAAMPGQTIMVDDKPMIVVEAHRRNGQQIIVAVSPDEFAAASVQMTQTRARRQRQDPPESAPSVTVNGEQVPIDWRTLD